MRRASRSCSCHGYLAVAPSAWLRRGKTLFKRHKADACHYEIKHSLSLHASHLPFIGWTAACLDQSKLLWWSRRSLCAAARARNKAVGSCAMPGSKTDEAKSGPRAPASSVAFRGGSCCVDRFILTIMQSKTTRKKRSRDWATFRPTRLPQSTLVAPLPPRNAERHDVQCPSVMPSPGL